MLDALDLAEMTETVSELLTENAGSVSVSFTGSAARGYDPGRGAVAYDETTVTVDGWVSDLRLDEIGKIQGAQVGDVKVLIRFADLATPPTTADRCRIADVDYRLYGVVRGPLDTHFILYAQRVA